MAVSGIAGSVSPLIQNITTLDKELADLQRQLSTGEKADTFSGLGSQANIAVGLSAQLSAISGYGDTISAVGTSLDLAQAALTQVSKAGDIAKGAAETAPFDPGGGGITTAQRTAQAQFDTILSALGTQGANGYLFSGTGVNLAPVDTVDHILNGNGSSAGLIQVTAERQQADLGASGLGRLVVATPTATSVSLSQDVAGSPFGFKLAGVLSSLTNAVVTGPAGSPAAISVDLTAGNPNPGDSITFSFALPDGSSEKLTLQATTSSPPGPGQFTIGATPAATTANLQAALTSSLGTLAQTSLSAASAVAAANDFFSNPPLRVAGPPFDTATAQVAGTPANTVFWYTGENGPLPPRSTATARIDPTLTVSYGLRANEAGIRRIVQNVATLAAASYSAGDPNALGRYQTLNQRINAALATTPGVPSIQDIEASLAGAQGAIKDADGRHKQTQLTVTNFLQQIEGVNNDQVAAEILALQTNLSASLSTTARLAQTTLLNFLAPAAA
jgi:flagellar hook-associated protein 3 FlgL